MASNKEKRGKISFTSAEGGGGLKRFCVTIFVLLVIGMVFGAVVIRTEAGHEWIEKRLSKMAGVPVIVDELSIGFPYVLVMDGVQSESFGEVDIAGFRMEEVRVAWTFSSYLAVNIRGCNLLLEQSADESWSPEIFARLGDLPLRSVSDLSRVTEELRKTCKLKINESTVKWVSDAGTGALASKIDFEMSRIKMPRQVMYHYYINVFNVVGPDGFKAHNVEREWLASESDDYIELSRSKDGEAVPGMVFWEEAKSRGEGE